MSTAPSPFLSYSLLCSVGADNGVSYVCVGEPATLTLLVSNPGGGVTLDSLTLAFSLGADATDLAASESDLTLIAPSGWTSGWGDDGLELTPPGGSLSIGTTTGLTFNFQVSAVNSIVGTTSVGVIETTANQTAYPPPFSIPMLPAGFVLTNLSASPVQIDPGGTVTLSWMGTPNQAYTVNYVGGPAAGVSVTAPSGGSVAWISPAIETPATIATFVVSATVQSVTVEASTTVLVAAPQILSFPQPVEFYGIPCGLVWTTLSASSCQLWSDGNSIDANAPANSPAGGYLVSPTAPTTPYTLYACNGPTQSASQSITAKVRQWALAGTPLAFGDSGSRCSLALTSDGSALFVAGGLLTMIGTATSAVIQQSTYTVNDRPWTGTVALQPGGGTIYYATDYNGQGSRIATVGFSATGFSTDWSNLSYFSDSYPEYVPGSTFILTPDGGTIYQSFSKITQVLGISMPPSVTQFTGVPGTLAAASFASPFPVNIPPTFAGLTSALQLSPDGSILFAVMELSLQPSPPPYPAKGLYALPTANFGTANLVAAVSSSAVAVSPDSSTVYCCSIDATDGSLQVVAQVSSSSGYSPAWTSVVYTPPSGVSAALVGLATEPSGGIFATLMVSGLTGTPPTPATAVANGLNVLIVNPRNGTATFLYNNPDLAADQVAASAMVADATGANLYLAAAGNLIHFVRTLPAPSGGDGAAA